MTASVKEVTSALTERLVAGIAKTAEAWRKANDKVTKTRVDFGRAVGKAQVAIVAAGGEDSDCESLIWPVIVETIGYAVEWDTVKQWVTAASVYDSLPAEVRDSFSTEALKTMSAIPVKLNEKQEKAGRLDRATFAKQAVEQDVTSVRDLRKAKNEQQALTSDGSAKKKKNADQAEEAVKVLRTLVSVETAARFENVEPEVIIAAVTIGVLLRDKTPKHAVENVTEGVMQFFTPTPDETDDGSGAPDTTPEGS